MKPTRASLLALATATLASLPGCGPIAAPTGVTDLRSGLGPLGEAFDAERGRLRLVLLLSPA